MFSAANLDCSRKILRRWRLTACSSSGGGGQTWGQLIQFQNISVRIMRVDDLRAGIRAKGNRQGLCGANLDAGANQLCVKRGQVLDKETGMTHACVAGTCTGRKLLGAMVLDEFDKMLGRDFEEYGTDGFGGYTDQLHEEGQIPGEI